MVWEKVMNETRMFRRVLPLGAALLLPLTAGAETFRCGKWLISPDMTVAELVNKCGAPTSKESKTEDVRARQANGTMVTMGQSTTERWTYDRGSQAAPMVVVIIDGEIKSIERLRK